MTAFKTFFLILITSIIFIACSKDEETEPIVANEPAVNCIPETTFSITLAEEMNGLTPRDSTLINAGGIGLNFLLYNVITPNNDGYNDVFRFELSAGNNPDSSFLIVTDDCGNLYYNSRFSASGLVNPPDKFPYWNGDYAPDSLSYHQPQRNVTEGLYNFELLIYLNDETIPSIESSSLLQITHY